MNFLRAFFPLRQPFCCLIFLCGSCNTQEKAKPVEAFRKDSAACRAAMTENFESIGDMQKLVRSGDLITRTGNDFTSRSLRSLNQRDQTYSHCGIAAVEGDSVFVYHALGGEWNPDAKIRRDPFVDFTEPYSNSAAAVFRPDYTDAELKRLVRKSRRMFTDTLKFDIDFDLKTDDRVYCAEYVAKCFEQANSTHFPHSRIKDFEFVGVDDIFLDPLFRKISGVRYRFCP